jgi:glycolate oxidase FAD binding subunit
MAPMNAIPTKIEEIQAITREATCLLPRGGGSKPALSTPSDGVQILDLSALSGIVEYEPDELTFTALAGTRLADVDQMLVEHNQYLPFDPPLGERGATLGGTVAAGLSGSGRYRYGGVRDFLLGIRFVDGQGQLVHSGGKVVKNAAGFDLSKLMVGSLGRLGVLVELSFKVFPKPEAYITLRVACDDLAAALDMIQRAEASRLAMDAIDLEPSAEGYVLWIRMGGMENGLEARLQRLSVILNSPRVIRGSEDERIWRGARELAWVPGGWTLLKVPLTPGRIPALEASLKNKPVLRRYFSAGQVAWLALEKEPQALKGVLEEHDLSALVIFGPPGAPRLGEFPGRSFYRRVKAALDPVDRFVEA